MTSWKDRCSIALDLTTGVHRVELRFPPIWQEVPAFFVSVVTVAAVLGYLVFQRIVRRGTAPARP